MLIDTHCHLDFPEFDHDREEVINRARREGISYIINVGSSLKGSKRAQELSRQYDLVYATVGVHPHEADKFNDEVRLNMEELARQDKVVAIGETGLDYYRNFSKAENQKMLFKESIKLAKDLGLPLVIHSRQAQGDTLDILNREIPLRCVMHCFSGDEDFLKKCLDLGFFISFTCNVTYPAKAYNSGRDPARVKNITERDKKAQDLRIPVKLTPLDRLMLETDAPYLSPEGMRGKRNEPSNVKILAEEISRIKGIGFEELAAVTTDNAEKFFNLP